MKTGNRRRCRRGALCFCVYCLGAPSFAPTVISIGEAEWQ